jgi:hypothetical protein
VRCNRAAREKISMMSAVKIAITGGKWYYFDSLEGRSKFNTHAIGRMAPKTR